MRGGDTMEQEARFFTLDEANRTLPLVARIVGDIVEAYPAFQRHLQRFHRLATAVDGQADEAELATLREAIDRESDQINDFIRELHQIGCLFKGFEHGLVDFYALRGEEPIFLCWRLGEDRIRYWHGIDAGYAGREPITPEIEDGLRERPAAGIDSPSS